MSLIKCSECGREISDKAASCPGCGSPVATLTVKVSNEPKTVRYNPQNDTFYGTINLIVKLAMRAIQQQGWTIEQVNENMGLVNFKTSISWGSWSGVLCSLNISEVAADTFRVTGTGKQNVSGGQLIALNIGNEAQTKARKAIDMMKKLSNA